MQVYRVSLLNLCLVPVHIVVVSLFQVYIYKPKKFQSGTVVIILCRVVEGVSMHACGSVQADVKMGTVPLLLLYSIITVSLLFYFINTLTSVVFT